MIPIPNLFLIISFFYTLVIQTIAIPTWGLFVIHGFLGGLLNLLISTTELKELKQYNRYKILGIGALTGYVYFYLYIDYNFPNGVMAIVAGYMGQDFITKIIEKLPLRGEATG